MGSHDRSSGVNGHQLASRYGKWRSIAKQDPGLAAQLGAVGADALSSLGYEPMRTLADEESVTQEGYRCLLTAASPVCQDGDAGGGEAAMAARRIHDASSACKAYTGVDFKGGDLPDAAVGIAGGPGANAECCQ